MMKEGKEEEKYIEMDCLPFNTFDTSDFKSENFVMHLKKTSTSVNTFMQ